MRGFRWMIWAPILLLATAAQAQNDAKKLDQLTQKLKKECEDQGGTFVLQSASAKYTATPVDRPMEGRVGARSNSSGGALGISQGGQTAYQASGDCKTSLTIEMSPPKP